MKSALDFRAGENYIWDPDVFVLQYEFFFREGPDSSQFLIMLLLSTVQAMVNPLESRPCF